MIGLYFSTYLLHFFHCNRFTPGYTKSFFLATRLYQVILFSNQVKNCVFFFMPSLTAASPISNRLNVCNTRAGWRLMQSRACEKADRSCKPTGNKSNFESGIGPLPRVFYRQWASRLADACSVMSPPGLRTHRSRTLAVCRTLLALASSSERFHISV